MNYRRIYKELINHADQRTEWIPDLEKHHVIPRSLGGTDHDENIVYLSFREHYIAHCLLYKIYGGSQIFSVECFFSRHRWKFLELKNMKRWIRKRIAFERAKLNREINKSALWLK